MRILSRSLQPCRSPLTVSLPTTVTARRGVPVLVVIRSRAEPPRRPRWIDVMLFTASITSFGRLGLPVSEAANAVVQLPPLA